MTVSPNVLMKHIIQINNNFTACVQSVRHQHTYMISDSRATGQSQIMFCSKSTQVCVKHFAGHRCHKSMFPTRIVTQQNKFYNLQVHFDETYTIRSFDAILFGNIPL